MKQVQRQGVAGGPPYRSFQGAKRHAEGGSNFAKAREVEPHDCADDPVPKKQRGVCQALELKLRAEQAADESVQHCRQGRRDEGREQQPGHHVEERG